MDFSTKVEKLFRLPVTLTPVVTSIERHVNGENMQLLYKVTIAGGRQFYEGRPDEPVECASLVLDKPHTFDFRGGGLLPFILQEGRKKYDPMIAGHEWELGLRRTNAINQFILDLGPADKASECPRLHYHGGALWNWQALFERHFPEHVELLKIERDAI